MSQVTTFTATPVRREAALGSGIVVRRLPAIVILVACGMLATAAFNRDTVVADNPHPVPTPSAPPMAAAAGDPSVPDAGTVFRDRKDVIEEPVPTF